MRLKTAKSITVLLVVLLFSLNAHSWSRVEDFNEGEVGESVQTTGGMDNSAGGTLHSDEQSLDGSLVAKMSINEGKTGFGGWGGIIRFPEKLRIGDSYWVQFYMYIPSNFNIDTPTNGSLKFLRVHTATPVSNNAGYMDFQFMDDDTQRDAVYRYIKEGGEKSWLEIASANERERLIPRDRWFKVELALTLGVIPKAEGGKSSVRYWVDDELVWNGENAQTLSGEDHFADALYIFTYWNGGAPKSQSLYIDNFIMTSDTPSNRDSAGFPFIGDRGLVTLGRDGNIVPPSRVEEFSVE